MKRNIIKIDESKCNGCGECIPDCPEGALKIIDGKAKLISEALCDGLGACVGKCPRGALTVEVREADDFDEEKAQENIAENEYFRTGCPGAMMMDLGFEKNKREPRGSKEPAESLSFLRQWPIQLKLVNPAAPQFKNANLLVAADCTAYSYGAFHQNFLKGKVTVIFCPKLDGAFEEYCDKLAEIISLNDLNSLEVVRMEVPCCKGAVLVAQEALNRSGKTLQIKEHVVSLKGELN